MLKMHVIGNFMKTGIICSSQDEVVNIGDYIQSLAALQFFDNNVDLLLNRDRLDEYDKDIVRVIMNGWFTAEPKHWPPSEKIIPLFVAFHINSLAVDIILAETGKRYLKNYEPIGCRDLDTVEKLTVNGIEAYFSGCLTLTLGYKYYSHSTTEDIYFVDPFFSSPKNIRSVLDFFQILLSKFSLIKKLAQLKYKRFSFYTLRKTLSFYREYSEKFEDELLLTAKYIEHEPLNVNYKDERHKLQAAEQLIRLYSEAKFVVTSRIHCALPCLALNTPVIYVENMQQKESSYCRLNGLRELFNIVQSDKGELKFQFTNNSKKINKNFEFKNKEDYQILRDKMIQICQQFTKK